jgi:hypothetical protein
MISISMILISAILFFDNVRFSDEGYNQNKCSRTQLFKRKNIITSRKNQSVV